VTGKNNKMTEKEEKLAAISGSLDETQVVSLKDLEERERLRLASAKESALAGQRRKIFLLSAALGMMAAFALAAVLAAVYLHHEARSSFAQSTAQGSR